MGLSKKLCSIRLLLPDRSTSSAKYISHSDSGTVASKVYENNVDDESFISDISSRMQALLERPKTAAFGYASDYLSSEEYLDCKVCVHLYHQIVEIFKLNFYLQIKEVFIIKVGDVSMGLPKHSPYKIFMNRVLNKMFESGQIKRIYEKWENKDPDCESLLSSGNPLGIKKLISILLIICVGFLLALIVLVIELCNAKRKTTDSQDVDFLRFEMIVSDINQNLSNNTRPNVRLLTSFQDACEKLKQE